MSLPILILFVGFAYVVLIGGLSLLKREELSAQFAIEAICITLVFCGLTAFLRIAIHPVLFLFILYLITMRVRLLVDIGTMFAKRRYFTQAESVFKLANSLWPDRLGNLAVRINTGVAHLQQGNFDEAVSIFKEIIQSGSQFRLGSKLEAAAHYNLGVAYLRQNKNAQAIAELNIVVESWPATEYARRASASLERCHHRSDP